MNSGIYFLLLRLPRSVTISLRHTPYRLPRGFYVYTGSAQRNLAQRIARHMRHDKKLHWHVDYLLRCTTVSAVRYLPEASRADEVVCAQRWADAADFIPVPKFGASDSAARSHLAGFHTRRAITSHPLWLTARPWQVGS
jgi:Uri superfamily endonuclease